MASVTISGSNDWSGYQANRIISATVSADIGSATASYTVKSSWTYRYGSYTRIRLDIGGKQVFDTGYCSNFNAFPCKQNSTKSGTFSISSSGNVAVRIRAGVSHNNLTDIDVSGTLVRVNPPSYNSISASSIGRTSAYLSASINTNGGALTDGGWDVSTDGGATWTYHSGGPTGATISGLSANTTYWYRGYAVNSAGGANSGWSSFTTSGNAPTINSISPAPSRTSCSLANNSISYDTNASYKSVSVKYGTSASYGSTASSTSLSGLSPNTTYYYSMTVTDNYNRTSSAKTGSFKTTCNAPTGLSLTRAAATTSSIDVQLAASGDTNAPITNYTLYYRKGTSGSYTTVNYGTNVKRTISGLDVDTNYQFYFVATNAGGQTTSSTSTFSTNLTNPTVTALTITNLLPFTCTATATASITPSRTLSYRFSKDGGTTWTSYQSSNVYNWTGLNEETTYTMAVQVKATHVGTNSADTTAAKTTTITTPADQAKLRRMIDGQWKQGKTFININGQWVKAKKVYVLVNGEWKINDNK